MAYIDLEYYREEYVGLEVADDATLTRLINRASRDIDLLTQGRIGELSEQPALVQKNVKLATASQVEFLLLNGETASTVSQGSGKFKLGSYSSYGTETSVMGRYSSAIRDYLMPVGLMYSGVAVRSPHDCGCW